MTKPATRSERDAGAPLALVVDDYRDAGALLAYVLQTAGFRVVTAETGPDALARARDERPDVVVMDLSLPGMSGAETARRMRDDETLADVPIVGHTLSKEPLAAEDRGLFDVFVDDPALDASMAVVVRRLVDDVRRRGRSR